MFCKCSVDDKLQVVYACYLLVDLFRVLGVKYQSAMKEQHWNVCAISGKGYRLYLTVRW